MHIDYGSLTIETESDVEQKVLMPLLQGEAYLAIPEKKIFTKQYHAASPLDKGAGKASGYFPDYGIWFRGLLVMVVEAKAPDVPVETGYREASLYARHVNQKYPSDVNPCRFVLACNGKDLLFGHWDAMPVLSIPVKDLTVGSSELDRLQAACGAAVLEAHAIATVRYLRQRNPISPYNLMGGPAVLNAKLAVNPFAAGLSPILRRYFSSGSPENNREITERAYVNSAEVTEYDRILEALLKDRLTERGAIVQDLRPSRSGEEHVDRALAKFGQSRPEGGQLQIIQGAVGSGKSLFMRRYRGVLQPPDMERRTRWSFVDFNGSPADLSHAERWLCKAFIESFETENPTIDLNSAEVLRGVFSRNIQRRKPIYEEMSKGPKDVVNVARAADLAKWQDDPEELARGIANYVLGIRQEVLVAVMDNVDRLDLPSQLSAFQLALWFMHRTNCFVILQMRDETYERYKNTPPLDTYRTSITFHITSPRFVDVVKKRLELSMEYLAEHAEEKQTYTIESGLRITYPKSELGDFLKRLYLDVFDRKRNVSRVLEALAGRNVRRALDMFVSIITSGHISPTAITSTVMGAGESPVTERDVIKVLMRTDYRFFSDQSGFIANIFTCDPDWQRPDNFLLSEILYLLGANRKRKGEIGLEGYFSCRHVADEMQRLGYSEDDTLGALNMLLKREQISADHMNLRGVGFDDSVHILPAGYIHVRILASRLEYLYGVLPTTPTFEADTARQLADILKIEEARGEVGGHQKVRAVDIFFRYLVRQKRLQRTPLTVSPETGSAYILAKIEEALRHFRNAGAIVKEADVLDT